MKSLKEVRVNRPSYKTIEMCIDAEKGSVASVALQYINTITTLPITRPNEWLINWGICDDDKLGFEGYHLVDDINAEVLNAYMAGYAAALTGGNNE